MLLIAIGLYVASVFCYYYEAGWEGMLPVINYPYRAYAYPLATVASIILVVAAILYLKRR
jgi:hypothetical protein